MLSYSKSLFTLIIRREALHTWIQRNGSKATYSRLINVFEQAGYRIYADLVRRIVDLSDKDSSGSGEEQCQPNTYPQYKEQQALSQFPQALPESTETYMVIEQENLLAGGISFIENYFGGFSA